MIRKANGKEEVVNVRKLIERPEERSPFRVRVYEEETMQLNDEKTRSNVDEMPVTKNEKQDADTGAKYIEIETTG